MKSRRPAAEAEAVADPLPPIGEPVQVKCDGFRCLAFRDKDGTWREWFHKRELPGNVQIVKLD